ncbi:WAT1-related protein At5g07050-like isoform X5 [Citrus sinensis]|uniref:WAT1-related protein At5g07050-like isoform X5 n=1 Tax=Citrus sinensis TaxID=2711 RepID=UPI002279DCA6|nr:WAT1-related protein At5g07050-like isoform X5 [Citrus sinensis]
MLKALKPYMLSIFCSCCYAGLNIISKVSLDKGMSRYVLVVYAHAFATLATAVLAILFERKNKSKITKSILRDIFFLGLLGAVLGRTLFFAGLEMERLDISKLSAQAKIAGTLVALGGAILSTLYKGIVIISAHRRHGNQTDGISKVFLDGNWIKGSLMLFISYLSLAAFFIVQTWTIKKYPAPITLTSLSCLAGTLLASIMTAILDHKPASWRLSWNITLLAPIYSGIVVFGITVYAQTLVIREKGPVFMTAFRPSSTVIVAILGLLILGEELHLGEILGSILIVLGLYAILWAKAYENRRKSLEIMESDRAGGSETTMEK